MAEPFLGLTYRCPLQADPERHGIAKGFHISKLQNVQSHKAFITYPIQNVNSKAPIVMKKALVKTAMFLVHLVILSWTWSVSYISERLFCISSFCLAYSVGLATWKFRLSNAVATTDNGTQAKRNMVLSSKVHLLWEIWLSFMNSCIFMLQTFPLAFSQPNQSPYPNYQCF